jgi:hypothetical protein
MSKQSLEAQEFEQRKGERLLREARAERQIGELKRVFGDPQGAAVPTPGEECPTCFAYDVRRRGHDCTCPVCTALFSPWGTADDDA